MMKSFFPLLTMFYHYQFRMKKSVELSLDWVSKYPSDARKSKLLYQSAKEKDAARRPFCECHTYFCTHRVLIIRRQELGKRRQ
jgi:hypothetical protein